MAWQEQNAYSGFTRLFKRCPELRMGPYIRPDFRNTVHLDGEGKHCPVSVLHCPGQFMKVFDSSFRRSVREITDSVNFQGTALYLHQCAFVFLFQIEINSGLTV